jgi:phosphohistidine phosphatase
MKRYLIIMRHAKTEVAAPQQRDFDRNLVARGIADAQTMGEQLKVAGIKPDCIIASSAQRTQQTATIVASCLAYPTDNIIHAPELYLCSANDIETEVVALSDDVQAAMIIGHNPGISEFIFETDSHILSTEMDTAGLVVLSISCAHWSDFPKAKKKLELYDYPKKYI